MDLHKKDCQKLIYGISESGAVQNGGHVSRCEPRRASCTPRFLGFVPSGAVLPPGPLLPTDAALAAALRPLRSRVSPPIYFHAQGYISP